MFTRELFGSVLCGTYFLAGPVMVRLALLSGTVPSVIIIIPIFADGGPSAELVCKGPSIYKVKAKIAQKRTHL